MTSSHPYYLSAAQAVAALGVTRATLYAYASRGQVRSEPVPGRTKERRYVREDVERLRERKEVRRDPARAAVRGLHWGGPVLDSALTLIHRGHVYYRGRDAVALAETATLEDIAMLLWAATTDEQPRLFRERCSLSPRDQVRVRQLSRDPLTQLQAGIAAAGTRDLASYDLRPAAVRLTGARIMRLLKAIVCRGDSNAAVHDALQAAWAPRHAAARDVLRRALVLCADHELNVSAFTARCAASAGATPYDVVSAALATLKGRKHGGATERVLALLDECSSAHAARQAIASRLRRGDDVPGFGHPLYADGDPRAAALLRVADASGNRAALRRLHFLWHAGTTLLDEAPNLDFGLAAIAKAYRLPEHAPVVLFALGRTVGWLAHAIEQYASDDLIRPRARYTGDAPSGTG